jgi:hypothetical protein
VGGPGLSWAPGRRNGIELNVDQAWEKPSRERPSCRAFLQTKSRATEGSESHSWVSEGSLQSFPESHGVTGTHDLPGGSSCKPQVFLLLLF